MRRPPTIGMVGIDVGGKPALTFAIPPQDTLAQPDIVLCGTIVPADFGPITSLIPTVVFNGTLGTDFGPTTARPISMTLENYYKAIFQHAGDPNFCPLRVHPIALDVTPPCMPTAEVTAGTGGSQFTGRTTCFASESTWSDGNGDGVRETVPDCPGDDPTCPELCNQRTFTWGASGSAEETIDFGNVSMSDASWAACATGSDTVWVTYNFSVLAEWNCAQSGCQDSSGSGRDCVNDVGDACGPPGSATSGAVCSNVLSVGDETSPPPGTVSSLDLVFTGSGWTTATGVTALFFGDPSDVSSGCTPSFLVTY